MAQGLSPIDRVHELFAALDRKDVTALAAQLGDDVRTRMGNQDPVEGKVAFTQAAGGFLESIAAIRHEIHSIWSVDDAVVTEMSVHYTRLDGGQLTLPCCNVFRLRDGLVVDYRVYMDVSPVYAGGTHTGA
jgi:ketosteroid isomerase-like protein